MNSLPLISVLIPVYNGSPHLAECIQSVLSQTLTDLEVVIVDDGSTDNSLKIALEFAARDARVRVIPVAHGGRCRTRNLCLEAARGEYIAWQDMDDVSLPERLEVELRWLREHGLDIVGSCAKYIGRRSNLLWFPQEHADIQHELLFRASLLQPTSLIRAEIARANLFNEAVSFEDYEMWTRLAPRYRMGNVPQVLFLYRSHETQSHVLESIAFQADLLTLGKQLFTTLFPDAAPEDRGAVAALAARQPAASLDELSRMGVWLARFSQTSDGTVHRKMLARWRGACLRSAHLGVGVLSTYRRAAQNPGPFFFATGLGLLCLLRVNADSRLFRGLRYSFRWAQGKLRAVKLRGIRSLTGGSS